MKRIVALVLCFMLIVPALALASEEDISIIVNGEVLELDVPPQIINGRTMLPARAIFEALDAEVRWVQTNQMMLAAHGDILIVMQIDNKEMSTHTSVDTVHTTIELDVAPTLINNRTMVPARAIAEAFGAQVQWVDETRTVVITQ